MRIFILFIIVLSFISSSCKKEQKEHNPETVIYYFKGMLIDSISGNYLPFKAVHSISSGGIVSENMQSNLYGEFSGSVSWPLHVNQYYSPPSMDNDIFLSSSVDSIAGYCRFKLGDLSFSETLQTNIYLIPVGFLNLRLVDTSGAMETTLYCSSVVDANYSWIYNAYNNGYADTTFLIKVFGNSLVGFTVNDYRNGTWYSNRDSAFIGSHDTIMKTINF